MATAKDVTVHAQKKTVTSLLTERYGFGMG
jgi:hypothetical protein